MGYTLRRLAAKCANPFVIKRRNDELQPIQVGSGVSGGAEAAVNAVRRLVEHLPDDHVMVKFDFTNSFNSVRRDTILISVADKMPEIYRFVYHCSWKLSYGDNIIVSVEDSQQGDPLSNVEYCDAVQPS